MRHPYLLALAVALAAAPVQAQTPSAGAGYVTLSLPATTATHTNYFTPPLLPAAAYTGAASAVTAGSLTISRTDWTGVSWTGKPYYVLLTSGAQAGRVLRITANTEATLTLDTTDESAQTTDLTLTGFAVAAGDQFEIIPAYTLATFFGATAAEQVLTSGTSAAAADQVSLWNWKLNRYEGYYFNSQTGAWLSESGSNANGVVLVPGALVAVTRPAGRPAIGFVQVGRVPRNAPLIKTPGSGFARYGGVRLPVNLALSQLVLGSNWTKGSSAFTADTLSVFNDTTGLWEAYYQRTDGSWRKSGSATAQDTTVIPSGASVVFLKRAAATGASSFQTVTLPYTP
jgi:uncharacterized protein (TIGR02597 family)